MKHLENNQEVFSKDKQKSSKSQKHDANLQKHSALYFQVGLIVCLLISYGLLEASFKTTEVSARNFHEIPEDDFYVYNVPVKVYEETLEVAPKKKKQQMFNNPVIKKDDELIIETTELLIEPTTNEPPLDPEKVTVIELPEELPLMNIMTVEQVPIFPGCENALTNEAKRQCMSDKIATHIKKKFNTDLAGNLGLNGEQKIFVTFKIDKTGSITDIKTNSKYGQLEKESERVIRKLPKMTPAKQKDRNVEVLYSLPIKFHIIN
ncbi:MAG: energy transducer TonB [Xanthomarina sp.]